MPDYQNLTVDNVSILTAGLNPMSDAQVAQFRRTYNASTGIVTLTLSGSSIYFDPAGTGLGITLRVY